MVHERQLAPRRDAPVIRHSARGSKEQALRSVDSVQAQQEAPHLLEKDTVARSSVGPRDSLFRSWVSFHDAWFSTAQPHSQAVEVLPLTVLKIYAVGALLKSGYRSPANLFHKGQGGAYQVRLSMVRCASASGEESNDNRHSRHWGRLGSLHRSISRWSDGQSTRGSQSHAAHSLAASCWSSAEHSSARARLRSLWH